MACRLFTHSPVGTNSNEIISRQKNYHKGKWILERLQNVGHFVSVSSFNPDLVSPSCLAVISNYPDRQVFSAWMINYVSENHYDDVIMGTIASQITSLTIFYSTVYSDTDQRKYQSSASLAFVWGIHRGPVNSPHKWPVTRKVFPFDDVIMALWDMMIYSYLDTYLFKQLYCTL